MLAIEERRQLLKFVQKSAPGTPYLRRVRIILLDDEGATQESIAAELQVPITRVRQMLRAYKREGIGLFPESLWSSLTFRPEDQITNAARQIVAELVASLEIYEVQLSEESIVTAVHESRKTIRKMRTGLRLFEPYFENHLLRSYRKRARKFMRRLARSRDIAVFLLNLEASTVEGSDSQGLSDRDRLLLSELADYWRDRQFAADARVREYLSEGKYRQLLDDLNDFANGDSGQAVTDNETSVAYISPVMIYQKLERVRTMGDRLGELQPEKLHALRITCKELRYTLEFFEGLLGPSAYECLETVKNLLLHLGDVNDARVHLQMIDQMERPDLDPAIALYRPVVEARLLQLQDDFPGKWAELNSSEWRERLAAAVAVL